MSDFKQFIKKVGSVFQISDRHRRRHLELNFQRIINDPTFRAFVKENSPSSDSFVIAHYQAKPRKKSREEDFYRVFGLYDSSTDSYVSRHDRDIKATAKFFVQMFSLDESIVRTVPTAVMVYFDAKIRVDEEKVYIEPSFVEFTGDRKGGKVTIWEGEAPPARKIIQPEN
ncbi:MAG: hypothetical protein AAGA60_31005 [Cyanobacteria bacterium P01_E01_bin.42]